VKVLPRDPDRGVRLHGKQPALRAVIDSQPEKKRRNGENDRCKHHEPRAPPSRILENEYDEGHHRDENCEEKHRKVKVN